MNFTNRTEHNISIINVNLDRATLSEANEFKSLLESEINKGMLHLIVNLNECEFIDSTFLGVLLTIRKRISITGGNIKLVGFRNTAQSLIDITGTSKIFEIYPSVKEALISFKTAA